MEQNESTGSAFGWRLDELAHAGRENLDADHVARYDAKMDAGAESELRLLSRFGMPAGARVVDLGAGTGQLTVAAARAGHDVTAVDVSPVMLEHLSTRIADERLHDVRLVRAGFLTYEHQGEKADVVYSRYALHHLPDFWKAVALTRMRAILRPGGLVRLADVVYSFPPEEAEERLEAWCATGGDEVEGAWSRAEIEEHVRDEHSTFTWLLEAMFGPAGLTVDEVTYSDDGLDAEYVLRAV